MYQAIVCQIVADTWTYAFGTWYSLEFLLLIREKKSFKRCQHGQGTCDGYSCVFSDILQIKCLIDLSEKWVSWNNNKTKKVTETNYTLW